MTRPPVPWRRCSDRAEQPSLGELAPAHCAAPFALPGLPDRFAVLHVALAATLEQPFFIGDQPLAHAVARHTGVTIDLVS